MSGTERESAERVKDAAYFAAKRIWEQLPQSQTNCDSIDLLSAAGIIREAYAQAGGAGPRCPKCDGPNTANWCGKCGNITPPEAEWFGEVSITRAPDETRGEPATTVTLAWLEQLHDLLEDADSCAICGDKPCLICFECHALRCEKHPTCNCHATAPPSEAVRALREEEAARLLYCGAVIDPDAGYRLWNTDISPDVKQWWLNKAKQVLAVARAEKALGDKGE